MHGVLTDADVEQRLQDDGRKGAFLVSLRRAGSADDGPWILSVIDADSEMANYLLHRDPHTGRVTVDGRAVGDDVRSLPGFISRVLNDSRLSELLFRVDLSCGIAPEN